MVSIRETAAFVKKIIKASAYHARALTAMISERTVSDARFAFNQFAHGSSDKPRIDVSKLAIHTSINGSFQYTAAPTQTGVRGGEVPGQYMQGFADGANTDEEKSKQVLQELARLPRNGSFIFNAAPAQDLRDANIVVEAFKKAGFKAVRRKTLVYNGAPDTDPIHDADFERSARSNVNKARNALEVIGMSPDDYYEFYERNLQGQSSHFDLCTDKELTRMALATTPARAEIIAARRKTEKDGTTYPADAAIVCGIASDRITLLRISYRKAAEGDNLPPPHQQAVKMLVVEAMKRANEQGRTLDVSGFTTGGRTVYERFGVFKEEEGFLFTRHSLCKVVNYWQERHLS